MRLPLFGGRRNAGKLHNIAWLMPAGHKLLDMRTPQAHGLLPLFAILLTLICAHQPRLRARQMAQAALNHALINVQIIAHQARDRAPDVNNGSFFPQGTWTGAQIAMKYFTIVFVGFCTALVACGEAARPVGYEAELKEWTAVCPTVKAFYAFYAGRSISEHGCRQIVPTVRAIAHVLENNGAYSRVEVRYGNRGVEFTGWVEQMNFRAAPNF